MNIVSRIGDKLKYLVHKYFLSHLGFGNRVSRDTWEKQYLDHTWDYLAGEDEQEHYLVIKKMLLGQAGKTSVLDVGCGAGVLYDYLQPALDSMEAAYTGIDISQNAIDTATKKFPATSFRQLDFDKNGINKKFDIIIFNESLYYFRRPLQTIQQTVNKNLNAGGSLIISMCDYTGHNKIWSQLSNHYKIQAEETVQNSKGQRWHVKLLGLNS